MVMVSSTQLSIALIHGIHLLLSHTSAAAGAPVDCGALYAGSVYRRGSCWLSDRSASVTFEQASSNAAGHIAGAPGALAAVADLRFYVEELKEVTAGYWHHVNISRESAAAGADWLAHDGHGGGRVQIANAELLPLIAPTYGDSNDGALFVNDVGLDPDYPEYSTYALFQYRMNRLSTRTRRRTRGTSHILSTEPLAVAGGASDSARLLRCVRLCRDRMQCLAGSALYAERLCVLHYSVYAVGTAAEGAGDFFELV